MALPETGSAPTFQDMAKNTRPPDPPPGPPAEGSAHRRRAADAAERNKGPILEVLKRVLPETGLVLEIGSGTGQHAAHFAPRLPGLVWQPTDPDPKMRASIDAWAQEAPGEAARPGVSPENKNSGAARTGKQQEAGRTEGPTGNQQEAGRTEGPTGNQQEADAPNLRPALDLDVTGAVWPVTGAEAIFSANMIHIAPWDCCLGLLAGAGRILTRGGDGRSPDRETTTGGLLILYGPFKIGGRHTAPSNESFDESLRARDASWGVRDLDDVTQAAEAHGLALQETVAMPANNLTVVFRRRG